MASMKCPKCGKFIKDDASYCIYCGVTLRNLNTEEDAESGYEEPVKKPAPAMRKVTSLQSPVQPTRPVKEEPKRENAPLPVEHKKAAVPEAAPEEDELMDEDYLLYDDDMDEDEEQGEAEDDVEDDYDEEADEYYEEEDSDPDVDDEDADDEIEDDEEAFSRLMAASSKKENKKASKSAKKEPEKAVKKMKDTVNMFWQNKKTKPKPERSEPEYEEDEDYPEEDVEEAEEYDDSYYDDVMAAVDARIGHIEKENIVRTIGIVAVVVIIVVTMIYCIVL